MSSTNLGLCIKREAQWSQTLKDYKCQAEKCELYQGFDLVRSSSFSMEEGIDFKKKQDTGGRPVLGKTRVK